MEKGDKWWDAFSSVLVDQCNAKLIKTIFPGKYLSGKYFIEILHKNQKKQFNYIFYQKFRKKILVKKTIIIWDISKVAKKLFLLVNNRHFARQTKIEFLVKKSKFCQKKKIFDQKIEMVLKMIFWSKNWNFAKKLNFWSKKSKFHEKIEF